jgi:hypothetical protein
VVEEVLVAGAEVVQARLAVGSGDEAVFRAASVTGEADIAFPTEPGEGVAFVEPEPLLALSTSTA